MAWANTDGRQSSQDKLVGRCILTCTTQHAKPHRSGVVCSYLWVIHKTKSELVGVNDALPQVLWTKQFLDGQGFMNTESESYQDNQSAMLLEKHGERSSGKQTHHLDVQFYIVKDQIASMETRVEYCMTGTMMEDDFTKPLKGLLFIRFLDLVLNMDDTSCKITGVCCVLSVHG